MHRRPHACSQLYTQSYLSTHTHSHTEPGHSLSHTHLLTVCIKILKRLGYDHTHTHFTVVKTKHTHPLTLTHTPACCGGPSTSHLTYHLSRVHSHKTLSHTHRGLHWSRVHTLHPTNISDSIASGSAGHKHTVLCKVFTMKCLYFCLRKSPLFLFWLM